MAQTIVPVDLTHAGPTVFFQFTGSGTVGDPFVLGGAASFPNQTSNQIFAGPTFGAAAAPAFRLLVNADMPSYVMAAETLQFASINF